MSVIFETKFKSCILNMKHATTCHIKNYTAREQVNLILIGILHMNDQNEK